MDFILEIPDNLPSDVCKDIIKRFEEDPTKSPGKTSSGFNPRVKKSVDLLLTNNNRFSDLDKVLYEQLKVGLNIYYEYIETNFKNILGLDEIRQIIGEIFNNTVDTGYVIQQVKKDDFYLWHSDYNPGDDRILAFIWYINKIEYGKGGTTDFYCNKSIQPEEGKLLLFPATWTYIHTGVKNESDIDKYIITGFIVSSPRDNSTRLLSPVQEVQESADTIRPGLLPHNY